MAKTKPTEPNKALQVRFPYSVWLDLDELKKQNNDLLSKNEMIVLAVKEYIKELKK